MLGESLEDPYGLEGNRNSNNSKVTKGLSLLPIKTFFLEDKITKQSKVLAIWPIRTEIEGYQLRRGKSIAINGLNNDLISMTEESDIGWIYKSNFGGKVIFLGESNFPAPSRTHSGFCFVEDWSGIGGGGGGKFWRARSRLCCRLQ